MLNDKSLKNKLLYDYEICRLYLDSGASTHLISEKLGIPVSSVKRALSTPGDRMDDYERLLPGFLTRYDLEQISLEIKEQISENIYSNRWADREIPDDVFKKRIDSIIELKNKYDNSITKRSLEVTNRMIELRNKGTSLRKIAKELNCSVSTVQKYLEGSKHTK